MGLNPRQFLRLARLVRHPPSPKRVYLILAVIAGCLLLLGYEYLFGWRESLTLESAPRGRIPR